MSTANAFMQVAGINVDVIYKNIKNLHIGVYPPFGRVRVAAPERLTEEAIRLAIVQRLAWIKKQQDKLRSAERQSAREMVSGESHYVWGSRLRLEIIEQPGRAKIETSGSKLRLSAPPGTELDQRRRVLDAWYRKRIKAVIPGLIEKWEPIVGKEVTCWTVRRMKTKWGSCNPKSGRISLNLELAKKHPGCLEYILVHEMTHLHERKHGDRFTALMDDYLPNWRALRDQLGHTPLAHEEWSA
ncbi:MAG: M48 family metallopeptidase [Actinomycetia bacterium]|nr:M48 family metallopeptidase [Actinomycetes bacterium]